MTSPDSEPAFFTTKDIAAYLGCSVWKVRQAAQAIKVGMDLGGRAGFRYTAADRQAIVDSLRPAKPISKRKKRRAA